VSDRHLCVAAGMLTVLRTAPLLDCQEGKQRSDNVWHEIVDALRKDVPEVLELIKQ